MSPALADCLGHSGPHWEAAEGLLKLLDKLEKLDEKIGPKDSQIKGVWNAINFSNMPPKYGENADRIFDGYVNSDTKDMGTERGIAYERILANWELGQGNELRALGHYAKAAAYGSLLGAEIFLVAIPLLGAAYLIAGYGELPLACYRKALGKLPEHPLEPV
jgi:hypothetical protein